MRAMDYGGTYGAEPSAHDPGSPGGGDGETLLNMSEAAQAAGTTVQALWVHVQRGDLSIHRLVENGRTSTAVSLRDILRVFKGHVSSPVEPRPAPGPRPTWQEEPSSQGYEVPQREPQAPQGEYQAPPPQPQAPPPYQAPVYSAPQPAYQPQAPTPPAHPPQQAPPEAYHPGHPVQQPHPQAPPQRTSHGPTDANAVVELQAKERELARLRDELNRERDARSRSDAELSQARQVEQSMRAYSERLEMRLEQTGQELAESKKETLTLARALGQAEGQIKLLSPPSEGEDDGRPHQQLPKRRRKPWWKRML